MAIQNVRIMISSRSNLNFPFGASKTARLADIRKELKSQLEKVILLDEPLFDVWINEDSGAIEASADLWQQCLSQVRRAHLVLALYNGDAGWADAPGKPGICHAELQEALNTAPAKLRVLQLAPIPPERKGPDKTRDRLFRKYVEGQHLFTGTPCETGEDIINLARKTMREAVSDMAQLALREARKGRFYSGQALDWNRLDMRTRQQTIRTTVQDTLIEGGARQSGNSRSLIVNFLGTEVVVVCSAIAAPFSVPEGREGASQLFLRDFEHAGELRNGQIGPVHIIACHRGITESQAVKQLGFPDATLVTTPFGVYVADDVHKIQMIFLATCRDPTMTAQQVGRLFDWLEQVGEAPRLLDRAAARSRIVLAIAKEATPQTTSAGR